MNKYYNYPNIELWQTEKWNDKRASIDDLIIYMQENEVYRDSDYVPSFELCEDLKQHPLYREKTHGIDDPAVVEELNSKGIHYLCTGQGGRKPYGERCWICLCPQKAIDNWEKLPVYMFFERDNEFDPLWTMKALKRHWDKVEMLERQMNFVFVIMMNDDPSYDRIYYNIMQEFSILFPCDINKMYMDVSRVTDKMKLKEVPNFTYLDDKGNPTDPDEAIEYFGDLKRPVLNLVGRWGNCDSLSRGLVMTHGMNKGRFDKEWLVHSEMGKAMIEDMLIEYKYNNVNDPAFIKEIEDKGLVYKICYNKQGERYLMMIPRQAYEEKTELPVVLVLQEVYEGNEHLAVTAHSYCGQWLEIAAQGECIVIFYVLEDIVSNDRAIEIIKDNAEEYHFDMNRVYAVGHSHDGYFTYAMANRNPGFFAAIAVQGMNPCPVGMNEKPDYTRRDPIAGFDMPTVYITGLCESAFPADEAEKKNEWVPRWQCVFNNYNIPDKTEEKILGAFESSNSTEKITCIAGDVFRTLWAEGIEHYLVDFLNKDGKNHLRVIRQQNMPHTVTPFMTTLSWDFMRRFERNRQTGEIIERY